MSEKIITRDINNPLSGPYEMDRDIFYDEQISLYQKGEKVYKAVDIVDIFFFDLSGRIIIQQRANNKRHNPNLRDKSMGGHRKAGDAVEFTVMTETVEELGIPSIIVEEEDFEKQLSLLKKLLYTVALVKHIDTNFFELNKKINDIVVPIVNKVYMYFGVYGGKTKTIDGEAKGILLYELDELLKEMKEEPDQFTHDLHVFVREYEEKMRAFIGLIKQYSS